MIPSNNVNQGSNLSPHVSDEISTFAIVEAEP